MSDAEVLVVVPTYNEAENIADLLRAVTANEDVDVLVVDDSSPDLTGRLVEEIASSEPRVHLLTRPLKSGLGRAYVAGFNWGLERSYQRFMEMDADFSHDPAAIGALVAATERCDLAIGSRYVRGGGVEGWPRRRYLLSRSANLYASALLGVPVRDSTSGFRCFTRRVLEAIGLGRIDSDGYAFQVEMAYRAHQLGFSIEEVPITFVERRAGKSKMSPAIVAEALRSVTAWGISDLVSGRRRRGDRPEPRRF